MATLAALTIQARILARDTATSNKSTNETPKAAVGGTTVFRLQNPVLFSVSATPQIWWSDATHYRAQTGITINDANMGMITITPAPATGFVVDYFFYFFADADYTEFLNDAARDLMGNGDPTLITDALTSALLQYALGHFYLARATQYAHRYSSSGGQAGQSVDVVTKNFQALAKAAMDYARTLRNDYYDRLGQRDAPASSLVTFKIDPVTPPR